MIRKPPPWELVGLVIAADKRLLLIAPALTIFVWAVGHYC